MLNICGFGVEIEKCFYVVCKHFTAQSSRCGYRGNRDEIDTEKPTQRGWFMQKFYTFLPSLCFKITDLTNSRVRGGKNGRA